MAGTRISTPMIRSSCNAVDRHPVAPFPDQRSNRWYVFCQIEVVQNGVSIQSEKAAGFSPVERKDPPPLLFGFYPIRAWVRLYDSPSNLIILP